VVRQIVGRLFFLSFFCAVGLRKVLFFACLFVTFGPAIALFLLIVSRSNQLIILTIGGSFFWLISILFSSFWWYIIPPLREYYWWVVIWSVAFQEVVRYLFYRVYAWGFRSHAENPPQLLNQQGPNHRLHSLTERPNQIAAALAVGLGAGIAYALVMYTSILWDATGPGTLFSPACPKISLFMTSSLLALLFLSLHVFQSIIAFEGFRLKSYPKLAVVWGSHLLASLLSLANLPGGSCAGSLVPIFLVSAATGVFSVATILRSDSVTRKVI